jgi:hypothetical protein
MALPREQGFLPISFNFRAARFVAVNGLRSNHCEVDLSSRSYGSKSQSLRRAHTSSPNTQKADTQATSTWKAERRSSLVLPEGAELLATASFLRRKCFDSRTRSEN